MRKTIAEEVVEFLEEHPFSQAMLARRSGVSPVIISRLVNGKQRGVQGVTQDCIREAICSLKMEQWRDQISDDPHLPDVMSI